MKKQAITLIIMTRAKYEEYQQSDPEFKKRCLSEYLVHPPEDRRDESDYVNVYFQDMTDTMGRYINYHFGAKEKGLKY